jgi:glucosylceramidase
MSRHFAVNTFIICYTVSIAVLQAATVNWKSSTDGAFWVEKPAITTTAWDNDQTSYISVDQKQTDQEIDYWGGCVNERPWDGLMRLSPALRDSAVRAMFDTTEGILTAARCPIGMSDMAMGKYADADSIGPDYNMETFSIVQDKKYLIPWLKAAMKWNPRLKVWASPWTQPKWMKTTNDYYGGTLKDDPRVRNALVLYLEKWCQAFRAEGINVYCIHLQNEMQHNNPGWLVTYYSPEQMRDFIKLQYAKFRQDDVPVETGLGTSVQDDSPPTLIPTVLGDTVANSYVSCVAVQYSEKNALYTHQTWPLKRVWLSETPATPGFAWSDGEEEWTHMHDYLANGVNAYNQWDIANQKNGTSNQGLKWGAPISIDTVNKTYTLTPIYYCIKHITYFVKPGAMRIKSTGNYTDHLAFVNRNGKNAVIVANKTGSSVTVAININGQKIKPTLPAHSFNTFSTDGTPLPDSSAYNQMPAGKYTGQSGTYNIPGSEGGTCLSYIHNNEWAYYYRIDFLSGGSVADSFQARVAGTVGGSIEVRIDSLTAVPVGTCTVDPTGGMTTWKTVSCALTSPVTGKHTIYLKFKGTGTGNLFNLSWWKFHPGTVGVKTAAISGECGDMVKITYGAQKARSLQLNFSSQVLQQNLKVGLFDMNGRHVMNLFKGKLSNSHMTLPLNSQIGPGVYVVKISLNDKIALTKTAALR